MTIKKGNSIYRVQFKSEKNYYDLYVRHVYPADMSGFVCLEEFLFNEENQLVINPRIERLIAEFSHVEIAFIPYHQIIRIDKVTRQGESRITNGDSISTKISPFPSGN